MTEVALWFKDIFTQITLLDTIDILIATFLIYQLIKLTAQTRAVQVIKGFGVILVVAQVAKWLNLSTLAWVSNYVLSAGVVVTVILFQSELRRALEKIGRGKLLTINQYNIEKDENTIDEIVRAVQRMSGTRTGALIVVQSKEAMQDIVESGTEIYAKVSSPLIENIFTPNTPLHDGAIIIKDNVLLAAGCFLPMTSNPYLAQEVGTRHRAALGLSENTDATVVVVSEETGVVSCAKSGKLTRYLDGDSLRDILKEVLDNEQDKLSLFDRIIRRTRNEKNK